jgi:hypothetical protein
LRRGYLLLMELADRLPEWVLAGRLLGRWLGASDCLHDPAEDRGALGDLLHSALVDACMSELSGQLFDDAFRLDGEVMDLSGGVSHVCLSVALLCAL